MIHRKHSGSTMALYAVFLVTVGVPMLTVGVDVSRVKFYGAQLADATQAACQAYANSLDVENFKKTGEIKIYDPLDITHQVFREMMHSDGAFYVAQIPNPEGSSSTPMAVFVCGGNGYIRALIPFYGYYSISATAYAKTKFSTVIFQP